ncbi:MAG: tRNA (adenosine(37)-N6)-dimethylallyltransferase MiaA [Paludibacteraceae bacterium]
MANERGTLFVVVGPTGVGKTDISLKMAQFLGCSIVSCDSRQMFRELPIGTAAPTATQLAAVKHHFVGNRSIFEPYSAGQFELDAIPIIEAEIAQHGNALMVGGSMLYADAVCRGIDDLPTIDDETRRSVMDFYAQNGIDGVRRKLKLLDPQHYAEVDLRNVKRMLHALEVIEITGRPFSEQRTHQVKQRTFDIVKIGLTRPRPELYERINRRVWHMLDDGLENEARYLYPHRQLNALNTVGYKELFNYFDGTWTRDHAIEMIQQNTRRYAKKQQSWFNRDSAIRWFCPDEASRITDYMAQHKQA